MRIFVCGANFLKSAIWCDKPASSAVPHQSRSKIKLIRTSNIYFQGFKEYIKNKKENRQDRIKLTNAAAAVPQQNQVRDFSKFLLIILNCYIL